MRVIVTGNRDWADEATILRVLATLPPASTVVHGACETGADAHGLAGRRSVLRVRRVGAEWQADRDGRLRGEGEAGGDSCEALGETMSDMSPDTIAVLDAIPLDALLAYWRKRTTVLADVPDAALLAEQTRRGNQDVETVEGIATFLGCSAESVVTWSRQNVDPLPHDFDGHGRMVAKRSALAAWWGRRAFRVKASKCLKRTPPRGEPNATECASAKSRKR